MCSSSKREADETGPTNKRAGERGANQTGVSSWSARSAARSHARFTAAARTGALHADTPHSAADRARGDLRTPEPTPATMGGFAVITGRPAGDEQQEREGAEEELIKYNILSSLQCPSSLSLRLLPSRATAGATRLTVLLLSLWLTPSSSPPACARRRVARTLHRSFTHTHHLRSSCRLACPAIVVGVVALPSLSGSTSSTPSSSSSYSSSSVRHVPPVPIGVFQLPGEHAARSLGRE